MGSRLSFVPTLYMENYHLELSYGELSYVPTLYIYGEDLLIQMRMVIDTLVGWQSHWWPRRGTWGRGR